MLNVFFIEDMMSIRVIWILVKIAQPFMIPSIKFHVYNLGLFFKLNAVWCTTGHDSVDV